MTTRKKKGSLLGVLDRTKTSMGARLIRTTIEQPITSATLINERLDGVEELINNKILSSELETILSSIHDIERITGKIAYGSIMPKECITLKNSLVKAMELRSKLKNIVTSKILTNEHFSTSFHLLILHSKQRSFWPDNLYNLSCWFKVNFSSE